MNVQPHPYCPSCEGVERPNRTHPNTNKGRAMYVSFRKSSPTKKQIPLHRDDSPLCSLAHNTLVPLDKFTGLGLELGHLYDRTTPHLDIVPGIHDRGDQLNNGDTVGILESGIPVHQLLVSRGDLHLLVFVVVVVVIVVIVVASFSVPCFFSEVSCFRSSVLLLLVPS